MKFLNDSGKTSAGLVEIVETPPGVRGFSTFIALVYRIVPCLPLYYSAKLLEVDNVVEDGRSRRHDGV